MIISNQLRDALNEQGQPCKQIVISYINKEKTISYLTYNIPQDQMYNWKYASRSDNNKDPYFKSWDFKNVIKVQAKDYLTNERIHEILIDLIKQYPEVNIINELNMPTLTFCDIEVDVDDEGFPDPIQCRTQVNTISWVHKDSAIVFGLAPLSYNDIKDIQIKITDYCKKFKTKYIFEYRFYKTEYDMLEDFFFNYFKKAVAVTGWNFFGYDIRYLFNRAKKYNINLTSLSPTNTWFKHSSGAKNMEKFNVDLPMHMCLFDYMLIYMKWDKIVTPKEQNKLDWVAEKVLGVKKVVHNLGFKEFWKQKPAEYVFYNAIDSILVKELDAKLKTASVFFGLGNMLHIDALTALSPVQSLQVVQCEYLYKENRVFPLIKKSIEDQEGYEGAFVYDPIPGNYKNVIALDFASLYPTTIRQFNISPDTFLFKNKDYNIKPNEIKTISGAVYRKDFQGFIPKILTDVYNNRKVYKKEMNQAITEKYELEKIYEKRTGKFFNDDKI